MDKERYIEQMLETENLTDALEDDDASWLLNWGASKLDEILQGVTNSETAGSRAGALMAVMRKMNTIVGNYSEKDPQALAQDLASLQGLYMAAFPSKTRPLARPDFTEAAVRLSQLSTRQALEYLSGDSFEQENG